MKNQDQENQKSRRKFIKQASVAAAGFMIVPRYVLGGRGYTAPSDKLLVAGIGAGGKGQSDIAMFARSGKADIAFLCDVDERQAVRSRQNFPKAKFYKDWREMLDKESKNFDAVSVSTPDHNHAVPAVSAMQLGKHVYVQKPISHDIYEARIMTEAARKYKVVTQMGNQGSSNDGTRLMREWYEAGLIGDVHTVYAWTDRPVWPQGIAWPKASAEVPKELDWDLWLGTAPYKDYVERLVPFNWRGWWDYGTGALGDMGCHLLEVPFNVLGLQYATDVQASIGSVYTGPFQRQYTPEGCPPSSHVTLTFPKTERTKGPVTVHWMDGGIQPERPEELAPTELFGDGGNGTLLIGTKGKMLCDVYGDKARLLPLSRMEESKVKKVKQKYTRVPNGESGHYAQWVEGCIAGYGKTELSSSFDKAGPLTEALLMANLAIRGFDIRKTDAQNKNSYPGRYIKLLWDNQNMRVTNFDDANQFVKRIYRKGFELPSI